MFRKPFVLLLAVVFLPGWFRAADPPSLDARVTGVIVYTSGSAQVSREGRVALPAGTQVLRSAPLPDAVDPQSVQVSFPDSGGGIAIEAVEVRRELSADGEFQGRQSEYAKGLRAREDALFAVQQELRAVEDSIQSRNETLAFLDKMRQQAAQAADRELASAQYRPETWQGALAMAEQRAEKTRQELRQLQADRRQVMFRLGEEQIRYNEFAQKGPVQVHQKRLYVTVTAQAARQAGYRIVYTVGRAWWEPSYRASAELRGKTVALDVFGSVRQQTGEDWEDVKLQLSTARPEIGTDVPTLLPWYIRTAPMAGPAGTGEDERKTEAAAGETAEPSPEEPVSAPAPTEAVSAGTATVFVARSAARIPGDGQFHKIPVSSLSSPVTLQHVAIPKILPHAFLQARMTNKAAFPLLPGVVEVMVGDSYVGRGMMKTVAPGEPVTLSLGVDEAIRISIALADTKGDRKRKNDRVATTNVFNIKATNFGDEEADLTILDQLPIARSGDVVVTYGPAAKNALRGATFPGQLKWEMKLAPRKSAEIEFDFTIEYPEAMKQALEMSNENNTLEYMYDSVRPEEAGSDAAPAAPRYENKPQKSRATVQQLKF